MAQKLKAEMKNQAQNHQDGPNDQKLSRSFGFNVV